MPIDQPRTGVAQNDHTPEAALVDQLQLRWMYLFFSGTRSTDPGVACPQRGELFTNLRYAFWMRDGRV
jgi:hypothetical protein